MRGVLEVKYNCSSPICQVKQMFSFTYFYIFEKYTSHFVFSTLMTDGAICEGSIWWFLSNLLSSPQKFSPDISQKEITKPRVAIDIENYNLPIIQSKHTSKLVISAKIQAIPEKDFSIASIAAERQHYIHCCLKQRLETVALKSEYHPPLCCCCCCWWCPCLWGSRRWYMPLLNTRCGDSVLTPLCW